MDKFKRKLTIASASQNLDTKSEKVVHRFIPMLVAENMNRIAEYRSGKSLPRIDLWNCIGMKIDKSFEEQDKYTCRRDFSSTLLEDKYSVLEELGISSKERKIVRDDDESTKIWLNYKLNLLRTAGKIYTKKMNVDICNTCDYLQAISEMHNGSCTRCDSKKFHSEKREVLMLNIPKCRDSLIDNRIVYPKNTKHIQSFFNQLPPRVMISKMRDYGLSLDSFDLPDYVLDPKIGVALMPEFVAETTSLSEITLVQGAAIATNTIPYASIMSSEFNHNYALLPKIPKMNLGQARNFGLNFIGRHLPFILMEHRENMTPVQLEKARQDYCGIINKINAFDLVPSFDEGPLTNSDSEENYAVSEILRDFENYQIREGREKLNLFFKHQRRKYSEKINDERGSLNSSDVKNLEEMVKLFYV